VSQAAFLAWLLVEPHGARPGPGYWDWRCLRCGGPLQDRALHPRWWRRRAARLAWLQAMPPLPAPTPAEAPRAEP
jgi:hypothetical protein